MDANHAMRELCSILGVGDFMNPPAIEGCVAAARRLAEERSEAHVLLDEACVAKHEPLPIRVGRLRDLVRRAQDGWAQANSRLDQSNDEVVAARGDLRVERERAEMLEKERDTLAARVKELEGRLEGARQYVNGLEAWGIKPLPRRAIPADVDMLDMLCNHAKAYIVFEKRDGSGTKVLLKDNAAEGWNGTKERVVNFEAPESTTAVNPAKPGLQPLNCPCGGKIEFGRERVGYCQKCGASCRALDPPPAVHDPDVRPLPFTEDDRSALTAALVEANRNTAKWRTRAQKCQQALRRIRTLTGGLGIAEDWGND